MRVLLLGDTHGQFPDITKAAKFAVRMEAEAIIQLGDFGFVWPSKVRVPRNGKLVYENRPTGRLLDSLDNHMAEFGLKLYWLDGNHEDFTGLSELGLFDRTGTTKPTLVPYGENLTYLQRGSSWEFDGVRFLALGGAVSVDKGRRNPGTSWWEDEETRDIDVKNAKVVNRHIDVMLTHDSPGLPQKLHEFVYNNPWAGTKAEFESRRNQNKILDVLRHHRPRVLFHGHFHYPYVDDVEGTKVRGLGCTPGKEAWWIFDTEEFKEGRF